MLMRGTEVRMLAITRWPLGNPGTSSNITAGLPILRWKMSTRAADFLVMLDAGDGLELADALDALEPAPQVLVRHDRRSSLPGEPV